MLIEGLLIGGIIKGIVDVNKSIGIDKETAEQGRKTSDRLAKAHTFITKSQKRADAALNRLANRKRAVLATSINDFIHLYEKISKINFVESDGIKELSMSMLSADKLAQLKMDIKTSLKPMSGEEIAVAYLLGGFTHAMVKDSERKLSIAKSNYKMAKVIAEQVETIATAVGAIEERADKLAALLAALNLLFVSLIELTEEIIEQNGYDRSSYSDEDIENIKACIDMMKTIKQGIIDVPLFDKDGALTQASQEAIDAGMQYIELMFSV